MEKSSRWMFTCWDFNSVMRWKAHKLHLCRVMAVGREVCPTTQKLHYQGFIVFAKEYNFASVKRIWPDKDTHWEMAKLCDEACISYCSKDGDLIVNHNILKHSIEWDDILE